MNEVLHPFLKWPGGKQWLINKVVFPQKYNVFFEPFLGGGSVFFSLSPPKAVLSDLNADLINLYCVMRDNPNQLKEKMIELNESHCKEFYYKTRSISPTNAIERAARFLYLNRTCFNGMYRVNHQGMFNVPIGNKTNCIYDIELFSKYSERLSNKKIYCGDFSQFINMAGYYDFIFCDPPYTAKTAQNQFIKYTDKLFCWNDQLRLLDILLKAKERGAYILSTNANCKEIKELYADNGFFVSYISRFCSISGSAIGRGKTEELIITSYDMEKKS